MFDFIGKMFIRWLEATQGQNLTRRFLAVMISTTWMGLYVVSLVIALVALFLHSEQDALQFTAASGMIADRALGLNDVVMLIMLFYFAAPHMDKFMDRFGKRSG